MHTCHTLKVKQTNAFKTNQTKQDKYSLQNRFTGETSADPITFLYRIKSGLESRSYGLNCAAAVFKGTPEFDRILERAKQESHSLERQECVRREHEVQTLCEFIARKDIKSLKRVIGDVDE
jgi:DNA mismatch repair ATPase MutS